MAITRLDDQAHKADTDNHQLAVITGVRLSTAEGPLVLHLGVRMLKADAGLSVHGACAVEEFLAPYKLRDVSGLIGRGCVVWVEPTSGASSVKLVGPLP